MQQTLEQVSTQVTEKWNSLSKKNKVQLGISVGCIIAVFIIVGLFFSKPQMEVLLRNRDTKDIAQAAEILDENKIKYQVVDDGQTIEVNAKDKTQAKLILTRENVPKGGYTFDDAINNTMSTTETERKAKMQQLAKVELEKDLETMEGIKKASVTLVIPEEKNSFLASKQESSASVLLELNAPQTSKQIEGIARYVSSSVSGLKMNNINIIDTEGNSLYIGDDEQSLASNKQQELKLGAEKDISGKVLEILNPIYDEVRISSNLILDFDQYQETREEYNPQESGKGLPSKETTQTSETTNMQNGLEPGTATNGGDAPTYQIGNASGGSSKTNSKEVEYHNNKVISNLVKTPGSIDYKKSSLSVNVFKNKTYRQEDVEKTLDGNTTWEMFKASKTEKMPIEIDPGVVEAIQYGTGIDKVAVYGYERPIFVDQEAYVLDVKDYLPFVLILLILIVGVLAFFKFRKHESVVETEPELQVEEMLHVTKQDVDHLEDIELKEALETKRRIEKFVDEKPEAVANLLRNWLNEDEWE